MKILVLGAGGPAGNNFLRSLKESNNKYKTYAADCVGLHLNLVEDYADEIYIIPPANHYNYIDEVNRLISKNSIDFVYAQSDVEVNKISENREKIKCRTFLPKKETIRICQDKLESGKRFGIKTTLIKEISDIKDMLKEGKVWLRARRGAGGRGATPVENYNTAFYWIKYWESRGKDWEYIAQPYLPGRNIAFQSVWKDGELIVSQARQRLEYIYSYLAPSGVTGTPEIAVTICEDKVNEIATESILTVDDNPSGVFCVDLKEKDGEFFPTEINAGRFFTTSYFFTRAGQKFEVPYANMPWVYTRLAMDKKVKAKKYNILPEGLYWIRHIDCGQHLI